MSRNVHRDVSLNLDTRPWNNMSPLIGANAVTWPIDDGLGEAEDFDVGAHGELFDILGFFDRDRTAARF